MVTVVANKIRTSLFLDSTLRRVIPPRDILELPSANAMDVGVNLHNLLVITSAELWTVYPNDPAIVICDALKCQSGIARLTLCPIVIPGGTHRPLHVYNVHRSTAAQ